MGSIGKHLPTDHDAVLIASQPRSYWMMNRKQKVEEMERRAKAGGTTYVRDGSKEGLNPDGTVKPETAEERARRLATSKKKTRRVITAADRRAVERRLAADKEPGAPAVYVGKTCAGMNAGIPIGGLSGLDAAVEVLKQAAGPMSCAEISEVAISKGLWKPKGLTPAATLSAAIGTEIRKAEGGSRFVKAERGKFALAKKGGQA